MSAPDNQSALLSTNMLAPNTILQGRYRIIQPLGHGGMGAVYQAMDENLSCLVAVKETFATADEHRRAFEREAKLLANLTHPSLPRVTNHFTQDDGQFLVMQFIPGNDLAELLALRERPFPLAKVLEWADHLLDALEELHAYQPPIVHRDIKPSNLKLTPKGKIILLDFGLAKGAAGQMSTIDANSYSQSIYGYTPHYAPLEQMRGAGTDPRSDIYSLGATLWTLLTAEIPPDALTRVSEKEDGNPDPLRHASEINGEVSPAIATVLHQALALNRNGRFVSAAEMRQSLREATQQAQAGTAAEKQRQPAAEATRLAVEEEQRRREEEERRQAEERELLEAAEREKRAAEERREAEAAAQRLAEQREAERQRAEAERARQEEREQRRVAAERQRLQEEEEERRQAEAAAEVFRKVEAEKERAAAALLAEAEARRHDEEDQQRREAEAERQRAAEAITREAETKRASPPKVAVPTLHASPPRVPLPDAATETATAVEQTPQAGAAARSGGNKGLLLLGVAALLVVGLIALVWWQSRTTPANANQASAGQPAATEPTKGQPTGKQPTTSQTPPAGMIYVPGGEFTMGLNGRDGGDEYERPAHRVSVKPFFIDTHEVTNEEYAKFIWESGWQPPQTWTRQTYPAGTGLKPVTGVTWDDARAYASWVGKRLPTEEEWEFAARGTDGRRYPWGNDWRKGLANADGASNGFVDVGTDKGTSPFGALDMVGNAWEWTDTGMRAYPGGQLPAPPASNAKVLRGGSFKSNQKQATATYRFGWRASGEASYAETGFRCAKDIADATK